MDGGVFDVDWIHWQMVGDIYMGLDILGVLIFWEINGVGCPCAF